MRSRLLLSLLASAVFAGSAVACTIPVFRYALDRWSADPFILHVPEKDRATWDATLANRPVDLLVQPDRAVTSAKILFPEARGGKVLQDPIVMADLPAFLSSPARREVVQRIAAGDSAVFVFVENGSNEDAPALQLLENRLQYLAKISSLPEQDPTAPTSTIGPGPDLKVAFSILSVDRNDPVEKPFIQMLMAGLNENERSAGKPIAFPIFGRGRVLTGLTGASFNERVIDEACQFLLGACSCQVKEMNPGWDLLLEFDWDRALQLAEKQKTAPAPLAKESPSPAATPESVILSGSKTASTTTPAPTQTLSASRPLAAWVGGMCVIAAALLFIRRK